MQNQWPKVFSPVVLPMLFARAALAASAAELDAAAAQTLKKFYTDHSMHQELAQKTAGILVFPRIRKAGIGVGAEYGQGVLQVSGESVAYFKIAGASVGATLGVAGRSEVMLFMTPQALLAINEQPCVNGRRGPQCSGCLQGRRWRLRYRNPEKPYSRLCVWRKGADCGRLACRNQDHA